MYDHNFVFLLKRYLLIYLFMVLECQNIIHYKFTREKYCDGAK